jgi:hypothetical protein
MGAITDPATKDAAAARDSEIKENHPRRFFCMTTRSGFIARLSLEAA